MPKRTGNRTTAKSSIYSPAVVSDFGDLPTPVVSPPPLPPFEIPPLVEFSPEPESELKVNRHSDDADDYGDDRFRMGPAALEEDFSDRPLSPLLLQESEPPDDVLSFAPMEEEEVQRPMLTGTQAGHTRSPVLVREPTMLENFSRTVRNYVPSSIPIPTAAPSPPRVPRPGSFGNFMTPTTGPMRLPTGSSGGADVVHEYGYGYGTRGSRQGRGSGLDYDHLVNRQNVAGPERERDHDHGRAPWAPDHYREVPGMEEEGEGWRFGQGLRESSQIPFMSRVYAPPYDEGDDIFWARWDILGRDSGVAQQRRLLFLGYASGLQIWDCTDLAMVSEVLNLPGLELGYVSCAAVLPRPHLQDGKEDPLAAERPIIGIIATTRNESAFIIYSLHRHHVVKRLPLLSPATFSANENFIVISTINPPSLHIFSPVTFAILYTISSTSLVSTPSAINRTSNAIVSSSELETDNNFHGHRRVLFGESIYSLSGRLLAYASAPPYSSSSASAFSRQPQTQTHTSSPSGGFSMHITQADISNVAMKVGGTVLSGMKSLGEKAYSVALSRAGFAMESMSGSSAKGVSGHGEDAGVMRMGGVGRFFSRSAPAAANDHHERRYPTTTDPNLDQDPEHEQGQVEDRIDSGVGSVPDKHSSDDVVPHVTVSAPTTVAQAGHYITVLDLSSILGGSGTTKSTPRKVAEFMTSRNKAVGQIGFSGDGNSIMVSPRDGQVCQVFQLRPTPTTARKSNVQERKNRMADESDSSLRRDAPWHVYDLRRGRTNAVIEGVDWAEDGRWIAIGTRKRTIHVFAVNPYGGRPDQRSHIEGRVRNYTQLQPLSTEVHPIVRLRSSGAPAPQKPRAPLSFTFIKSTESSLPVTLLPPPIAPLSGVLGPSSLPKSDAVSPKPTSPHRHHRPTNFQDILVFDPTDGLLSLRRIFVDLRPRDQGISIPTSVSALGATSTSLPGMGGGRLGPSPPTSHMKAGNTSSHTQNTDTSLELTGKEGIVATWSLQRHRDWREIKRVLEEPREGLSAGQGQTGKTDVLAHAELSTCSTSPQVLPRSIYLSHQFSFHTLGEDYHALIRRYQLDIGGSEIEVRKKVQVSAYGTGVEEEFLEGFSAPRDIRRQRSSFDEPLASALSAGLDHPPTKAILPMLPNGMPGSNPISFRNSIPIRKMAGGLSDGMTEGIGRIRREIHKARSPPASRTVEATRSESVSLEFDEEDEDFLGGDIRPNEREQERPGDATSRTTSRGGDDSSMSVSAPSTSFLPLEEYESDDLWQGWDPEDKQAIDDAERFDHISVVGFLDEEHASMVQAEKRRARRRGQ